MAFLHGAFLGITLATVFGIGPAFFLLIQTSISKGFKYALLFDIGVLLSDAMVVALMMMTNIKLDFGDNDMILPGIAAGIIVIIFGVFTYRTKPEKIVKRSEKKSAELEEMEKKLEKFDQRLDMIDEKLDIKRKGPRWYIYISKGLVMNLFNPFVWIFWMTTVGAASGADGYNGDVAMLLLFFFGTFATIFGFDILKIIGSYSLKRFFTEKRMKLLNQGTGIVLVICGLILMIRVLLF